MNTLTKKLVMAIAAVAATGGSPVAAGTAEPVRSYENSFLLLHLDHHAREDDAIGRAADPVATREAISLLQPDIIQIHAKGRPGLATYDTKVGFLPLKYERDVQQVWHDIARKDGYLYWIYYNIGRDEEIMHRHPEWNRADADGRPRDAMLCYHTGVLDGYLWPMIAEMMDKYHPDGLWFDGSSFTIHTCYCQACQKRFLVEQGMELPHDATQPGWDAFKEMQRSIYREFQEEVYARIKRKDPRCSVVFNGAYTLMMPEEPRFGDCITHDKANWVDVLSAESHFMDAQGKPFDMMTTIWYGDDVVFTPKPQGQIEQEMAIILANGGRYFLWDNPTKDSGLVRSRFEYAGKVVTPFVRARQSWCLGTERVPDVTLLYSAAELYHDTRTDTRVFPQPYAAITAVSDTLDGIHLNYEYTTDFRLEKGDINGKVLVLDDVQALTPRSLAAVRAFVERGGILLEAGRTALQPEMIEILGGEHATLLESDAQNQPLLTVNTVGRGQAYYTPQSLRENSDPTVKQATFTRIFDRVLPIGQRILAASGLPSTVEIGLRRGPQGTVVHLVNRAPGTRVKTAENDPYRLSMRITDIPLAPGSEIRLRHDRKPRTVTLQPEGTELKEWHFSEGLLTFKVPAFAIHQMVVVE